ncbi:microtubule-associated protein 10 [Melanotaenia boesemani]|uniref:microtubule-associated protein 10 n=1 Tax=Melanotaenia boesemani TaxID=1250792 RepID=UPI001C03CA24|nr:microtubule-associated protein 10 [Melanotaenia boesemani]
MSGYNPETLFSFEFLVKNIRLERHCKVYHELALGVRLLDFPTLLIYQSQRGGCSINQPQQKEEDKLGEYVFNRGKSCFFKMNLSSLHVHLSNTPLYAMVLDMTEETPRLVGSSLISLAKAMDRIRQDVTEHGFPSPSCHREWGLTGICNLAGERIGKISLSYKLVCLGASLLPHITEIRASESTDMPGGQEQEHDKEKNKSAASQPLGCSPTLDKSELNYQTNDFSECKILLNEDKQSDAVHVTAESQTESSFKEDFTVFCPPHLYYSNTAQERSINKKIDYKMLNLDLKAFSCEDSCSEDEEDKKEVKGSSPEAVHQTMTQSTQLSDKQEAKAVAPNVLREALRQLPLLNALVTELSQLNGESPHQSFTADPSQAWVYRPASPGLKKTRQAQTHSLHKTRQRTGTDFKIHLQPPINRSTPIANSASLKMKDHQADATNASKFHRKKLMFGTTKTFNLRLKQISPLKVKHRECMELIQNETPPRTAKGKAKSSRKCSKRKSVLNRSPNLNENIETVIERVRLDSVPQETITVKQKTQYKQGVSEKPVSQRNLECIHIPSVDSDTVYLNNDQNDQSESESEQHSHKIELTQSSKHSSPKSLFSDSSVEGNAEADYADDFDSLESSDAYSPDPLSSPEPSRAKTPLPPVCLDFCNSSPKSAAIKKKPVLLPVPVKASSSPHRTLMDTHIIRPRAYTSAISFFSDEDDEDGLTSVQTVCSGKQIASNKVQQGSCTETFKSSSGQRSESVEDSNVIQGLSTESVASLEAQEAEELEDELGFLDFRKEYQHISELVASKLPGYTM